MKKKETLDLIKNNVLNIGFNTENYQKIDIADSIKKFIPNIQIKIIKKDIDIRDYRVDFSKLERFLNIKNTYVVKDGIKEIIDLLDKGLIANPRNKIYYNLYPNWERKIETGIRRP